MAIGAAGSDRGAAGSESSAGSQQGRRAAAVGSDRGAASYRRIGPRLTTRPGGGGPMMLSIRIARSRPASSPTSPPLQDAVVTIYSMQGFPSLRGLLFLG